VTVGPGSIRPARRPYRRPARCAGDTGSLAMAMLLAMVGVSLAALLLPMMVTQIGSTREEVRRSLELNAAEAGLDIGLGHIRGADDGAGVGVLANLPCGLLAGTVGVGAGRYEVTVDYFSVDPVGQPDTWIPANRISCLTGGGPLTTPAYALLRAQGTAQPVGAFDTVPSRSLRGTYTFQTTNQNIAGGLVHVYQTTSTDLCMDAGSSSPAAGANLQMQPCSPGDSQQTFAYDTRLNLVLVSAKTPSLPLGMCLDAGTPHAAGAPVVFQPCATTTSPQQQWSINDSANFEGTTDGKTLDGYCFHVQTPDTPGSFVVLSTSCHGGYDNIQTFQPEPPVGAGAAGPDANQLVNFNEFGRCLDVTEQNVNYPYLIAWPCKQAPDPANVLWNQKWALPAIAATATEATGPITTKPAAGLYCLQSPGSIAAGQYVLSVLCPLVGGTPPEMTWTVRTGTGSYATSYRIEDSSGFCLTFTDPAATPADLYPRGKQISKIVVATCDGSTAQKWNAPPNILQSLPLKDVGES
jgi:Ricin-type beta-trefoil lectin domain